MVSSPYPKISMVVIMQSTDTLTLIFTQITYYTANGVYVLPVNVAL